MATKENQTRKSRYVDVMKITKQKLKLIIREETVKALEEVATCHNKKTGHFDDCESGAVYSLTDKGARENNIDKKYVQRGTVTKKKASRDEPPTVQAKFGVNSSKKKSAGRKEISGTDISPKYSVSKYPEKYEEEQKKTQRWNRNWKSVRRRRQNDKMGKPSRRSWLHGYDELDKLTRGVDLGILEGRSIEVEDLAACIETVLMDYTEHADLLDESEAADTCRRMGFTTAKEATRKILLSLNNFAKASDGKLFGDGVKK